MGCLVMRCLVMAMGRLVMGCLVRRRLVMGCLVMRCLVMGRFVCESLFLMPSADFPPKNTYTISMHSFLHLRQDS